MRPRLFFLAVTAFWLVMNYLLYRSQAGGHSAFGGSVPVEGVWEKILTAPDNSSLDIFDHNQKIGFGRWGAGTADSPLANNNLLASDYNPGVVMQKITGYGLSFEGGIQIRTTNRVRFQSSISLDTNKVWKDLHLRASVRPSSWDLRAAAADQTVVVKANEDGDVWTKTFKFSELQDPQALLGDFADPVTLGLLGLNRNLLAGSGSAMQWEAHEDRMKFGQSYMRVYRLDSFFLGQRVELVVSRIGEILWVDLPFKISLRNQALGTSLN